MAKSDEKFSEKEANERFLRSLQAAVNTPPKPLKDKPKKRGESRPKQRKKRR